MKILAIESSCDETACAVVEDGVKEISSVVASSKDFHESTGGVVPEVASRKQLEFIFPVIEKTLEDYQNKCGFTDKESAISSIDSLAVTVGPGLIGSLVVGVAAAKSLALAWQKPLIPVNHLVGHIYANFLKTSENSEQEEQNIEFPAVCLLVSGGHTDLVLMQNYGDMIYLGGTLDDAAGESFDKVARMLGISKYLGGAVLSEWARKCGEKSSKRIFPRPMLDREGYDFSFSGLKTAVRRYLDKGDKDIACTAREFEEAVVEVLTEKTLRAAKDNNVKTILVGGGVSANTRLKETLQSVCKENGITLHIPPVRLCTDNAVYIASAAYFNNTPRELSEIKADPSLGIMSVL